MIKSPCITLLSARQRATVISTYPDADTFMLTPNFGKRSIKATAMRAGEAIGSMEFNNIIIPPNVSASPVVYPRIPFTYGVVLCTVNGTPAYYFGKVNSAVDDRQMISVVSLDGSDWNTSEYVDDISSCILLHAPIADLESLYQPEEDADAVA